MRTQLAMVMAVVCLTGCRASKAVPAAATAGAGAPQAFPVSVEPVPEGPVADTSTYVASIQSRDSMVISPLVSGIVTQILVHSGDQVAAGAPLLQIDPSLQMTLLANAENARKAAQPAVVYAKQQLDRIQALYDAKIETKADLDQAQSSFDQATAQLAVLDAQIAQQKVQLGYYRVVAPRAGTVGDIPVKTGDQVSPATELTTLDQPSSLEVYVQVPIEKGPVLKPGLPMEILDGDGRGLASTQVRFVSPQVDTTTQTILVKADLSHDPGLRTLQYVQARITWSEHQALLAPVLAVTRINGSFFVFVAQPQGGGFAARQAPVTVGQLLGNQYEIVSGLKAGEKLIVSETQLLADGMPVLPLPPAPPGGRGR